MISLLSSSFAPRFAHILLDIKAIQINTKKPYTWASGKQFPIYCDNRRLLSEVVLREEVKEALITSLPRHFAQLAAIAAVATAAIPYGMMLADAMRLPFGYVRPKSKAHGLGQQIEGRLSTRDPLILFEDLVSTGGSCLSAAATLQAHNYSLLGIVALFSYNLSTQRRALCEANLPLYVLCRYEDLLEVAQTRGLISDEEHHRFSTLFQDI